MTDRCKVLYIAGWGRSGSTILGDVLGSVENLVHVGELCFLWDRGLQENRLCSCGHPFRECAFWVEVLKRSFGSIEAAEQATLGQLLARYRRTRVVPRAFLPDRVRWIEQRFGGQITALERLYRSIAEVSSSEVVVDSSKLAVHGLVLTSAPSLDVHWVHLIRDPRAVAYSWRRTKFDPARGKTFLRQGAVRSTAAWLLANLGVEVLSGGRALPEQYRRIRYEDFAEQAETPLRSVLGMLGLESKPLPLSEASTVAISESHSVSGNPSRFDKGRVELRPDYEWREKMPKIHRLAASVLAFPLLRRYGYPLWV